MQEYELIVEEINPCGGEKHARKSILEIEAESPIAYVKANGHYPVTDTVENADGSVLIITGNGKGNILRYTFTPC